MRDGTCRSSLGRFWRLMFVLTILIVLAGSSALGKEVGKPKTQVVLVLIDKVTWQEISEANAPFLKKTVEQGAVGMMSNRTASAYANTARSYLTIGTGNRALTSGYSGLALNRDETFDDEKGRTLFRRQTGLKPGDSSVFYLNLAGLQRANLKIGYTVKPGLLGEALNAAGLKTAVLGNADIDRKLSYERQAAIIAMDEDGAVDYGDVGRGLLKKDKYMPYGMRTDYDILLKKFSEVKDKASLIVIETGDSRRADSFQSVATTAVSERYKTAAIERADDFLSNLYRRIDASGTTLMVISPSPPVNRDGRVTQQLTPILILGSKYRSGFLTSGFTRREAIVASVDIAPTILRILNLPIPYYLSGQPMTSTPSSGRSGGKVSFLVGSINEFILADKMGLPLIIMFVILNIAALLVVILVITARIVITRRLFVLVTSLLLAALALPLVFFIIPILIFFSTLSIIYLALTAVFLALGTQINLNNRKIRSLLFIPLATVLFLLGNLLFFGAESDLKSVFGYSPIAAGRFYGMGNQTMSVLVAAVLVTTALYLEYIGKVDWRQKLGVAVFFLTVLFFIGFPTLGANTGGTLTAAVAFIVAYLAMFRGGIKARQAVLVAAAAISLLGLFIAVDVYLLPVKTHMGRALLSVVNGGYAQFWQIAARKINANIRIFKYTSWSYLLLTIIVVLLFLRFFRSDSDQKILSKYAYLSGAFTGGLVGGVVGALTNDSGISIPAIILAYFLAVVFYLQIYDRYAEVQGERSRGRTS